MDRSEIETRLHRLEAHADEILKLLDVPNWDGSSYSNSPDAIVQQLDTLNSKLDYIRDKLIVNKYPLMPEQEAEIKNLVQQDRRIDAIKKYHALVPVRLKWAVSAIEDMYEELQKSQIVIEQQEG